MFEGKKIIFTKTLSENGIIDGSKILLLINSEPNIRERKLDDSISTRDTISNRTFDINNPIMSSKYGFECKNNNNPEVSLYQIKIININESFFFQPENHDENIIMDHNSPSQSLDFQNVNILGIIDHHDCPGNKIQCKNHVHISRHNHGLVLLYSNRNWFCNICRMDFSKNESTYYCSICDFDVCNI